MKTIHKYPLNIVDRQLVHMPVVAQPLSVQMQRGQLMLWALVEDSPPAIGIEISIYGTGNPIPADPGKFIGTVQDTMGLVWHVFDSSMVDA